MKNLNRQNYVVTTLLLVLALVLAGCVAAPAGPVHVVVDNLYELAPVSQVGDVSQDSVNWTAQPEDEAGARSVAASGANQTGFSNLQVGGYVDVQTNLYVGDWVRIFTQTPIAVTNGAVITPTGTYQPLTSSGEVTATLTTSVSYVTAGDLLVLLNASPTVTTTINIADSGTAMLSAAAALGQYDSLTLWFDGTNWVELSRSNN